MNYEQKYNEALERARYVLHTVETAGCAMHKDLLTEIFPELADSEDERIRREIIDFIQWAEDRGMTRHDYHQAKRPAVWIAYLEKQKESLHISETCKENAEYFTSQCGDNRFEIIDKAKRDIIAKTNIESRPEEMAVLDNILYRCWQMGWLGKYDVIVPEQKPLSPDEKMNHPLYLEGFDVGREVGKVEAEQKPAEWSEEDEKLLNYAISMTDDAQVKRFLKSLRPQPKVELSEDVKKTLDEVSHILVGLNYKQIAKDYKQAIEKLLDSRPSWKPSEQEKGALRTAIHILTDERSFPKAAAQLQNILNAFDGKESRKDWKPSKEQMDRLSSIVATLRKDHCDDMADAIAEIYHGLEKLM